MTSTDFEKATDFDIDPADIEKDRASVGIYAPSKEMELFSIATTENIRNFEHGYGDDNPLYCDARHGASSRWGGQVAPPIMAAVLNEPLRGDRLPKELRGGSYRGIHAFVSGSSWEFYRPIRPGDQIFSIRGLESVEEKESEFAGRSIIKTLRDIKFNQDGDVVAVYTIILIHTERKKAREKGKNKQIPEAHYTDEDMAAIEALYAAETRQGSEPLHYEDVTVGDVLPPKVKGPLTTTDIIVFHAGGYGFVPYRLTTGRLAHINRQRIAPFFVKNASGIPDVAQRVHWDDGWAQAIGNPRAYDYGVLRECWLHHLLTDWVGDHGYVTRQHDEIRKFNYLGDTTYLAGEVTGKRIEDGQHLVDVSLTATNQRGEVTVTGTATALLPSRDAGPIMLPTVPADVRRAAVEALAIHHSRGE
ncbi:MAG: hypothetical protein JWP31_1752 [Aeromicrobium sp.]|nr:hypothetical protein [Aeromicrobium sp.]